MERTVRVQIGVLEALLRTYAALPAGNRFPGDVHLSISRNKGNLREEWKHYDAQKSGLWKEHLGDRSSIEPGDEDDPGVQAYLQEWAPTALEEVEVTLHLIPWERLYWKYDEGDGPELPDGFQRLLDLGVILHPGEDPRRYADLPDDFPAVETLRNGPGILHVDELEELVAAGELTSIDGIGKATARKIREGLEELLSEDSDQEGDE